MRSLRYGAWSRKARRGHYMTLTKWIFAKIIANKICLEERAHLRVARTRVIEDQEVDLEREHVD